MVSIDTYDNKHIQRLGLITEAPDSEVDLSIVDGFQAHGVKVDQILPGERWRTDLDAYLISGPFYPLSRILPAIRDLAAVRPPHLIIWLTEQRASDRMPGWYLQATGAGLRYAAAFAKKMQENGLSDRYARLVNSLFTGTRYRLPAEIKWLHSLGYLDLLAVLTPSHKQFYQEKIGVPAEVIPYGYHHHYGHDLNLTRDIDVVFLGSLRDRRRLGIINQFERQFQEMGVNFVIKDGSPERGLVFGDERTILLNRTKILLSIMRQPWDDPVFRMLLATPNGTMLVSEPVHDEYPYKPGTHLATAEIDRIPETVRYYLNNEPERLKITTAARKLICDQMTCANMAGEILTCLNGRQQEARLI